MPSKTLLAASVAGESFAAAMSTVRTTIARIAATEDARALQREGLDVVDGRGAFVDAHTLAVDGREFRSPRIVVATGSRPALPPLDGLVDAAPLTNETLFDLGEQPDHLAVLGGGPIGCEMALAFCRLGSHVTLVEREPRLLPRDEPEAAAVVREVLERHGVDVRVSTDATMVRRRPATARVLVGLEPGEAIEVDDLLVATGRSPVTDGLDAGRAGITLDRGGAIHVDDTMASSSPGVWAIGDVTGRMQFTHAAARMAMVATSNAMGGRLRPKRRFDETLVPWVTYVDPEVAHVGMSEAEATAHGGRVAWLPLDQVDRAVTSGRTDGFVKLIAGPRRMLRNAGGGRLLGATIVAPTAGEMIHEVALAMRTNMFTGRLAQTVHAYPTYSMGVQEAAAQFFVEHRGRTARPARPDHDGSTPPVPGPGTR